MQIAAQMSLHQSACCCRSLIRPLNCFDFHLNLYARTLRAAQHIRYQMPPCMVHLCVGRLSLSLSTYNSFQLYLPPAG